MRRLSLLLLLVVLSVVASASDPAVFSPSMKYRESVPTVQQVLGYNVGDAFTHYSELERYYRAVAAASDRMKMEPYGKSVEGRTLYTLIISAPENLAKLDAIRAAMARLADPRQTPPDQAQQLAASNPTVVWLSYNVHGNESVSSEAALQVVYELNASEDPKVLGWLKNAVILIDPIVNPDGRERYVHYYRSTVGAKPRADRFAAEHQERWPGGRFNHYLFDLNRDWAWQSQPESVARLRAYRSWNPQVHVDFHEMGAGSTYYFAPPAKPIHSSLTGLLDKWFEMFGRGNATAFDQHGFRYFTREGYDLLYPAFGDSWPSLNGAIGMTYEQGGGGVSGLVIQLADNQRVLTLKDRAARHFVSSLATIDTSAKNREARLRDFYDFRRAAIRAGAEGPVRQYFIVPGRDPVRAARLVEILMRQGIEVQRAESEFDAEGLAGYFGESHARKRLPAGTYVVDLAQPAGLVANAVLERDTKIEDYFFYDVTAWSLPLAAGVEAYAASRPVRGDFKLLAERPRIAGGVEGPTKASAYVFSWEQSTAMGMLSAVLQGDLRAYVAPQPFKVSGRQFSAGSIIVPAEGNPADLGERIRRMAEANNCTVYASTTNMVEEGMDLGSNRVRFLRKPKIAVLTDVPVSPTEYGALWHFFEQQVEIPFTPIRTENLRGVELTEYNILIIPGGSTGGYARYIDKGLATRLDEWVRNGGILIGMGGGAVFTTKKRAGLASIGYRYVRREDEEARLEEEKEAAKPDEGQRPPSGAQEKPAAGPEKKTDAKAPAAAAEKEPAMDPKLKLKLMKWSEREEHQFKEEIAGAILRTVLDTTHPLGFGLDERLAVLNRTAPILELTDKGENVAYYPAKDLKLSGYMNPEAEKKLAHTAYAIRERKGRGHVILFADSPVFRGFWDSTSRMLVNAIFFGNITNPYAD